MQPKVALIALACVAALPLSRAAAADTPAHNNAVQNNLHAQFTKYDVNKDGFLDEEELAKAFRGPSAKPIEDKVGAAETHGDHIFLKRWDANKDGRISRAEFEKHEQQIAAQNRQLNARRNVNYSRNSRSVLYRSPRRHSTYRNRSSGFSGVGTVQHQLQDYRHLLMDRYFGGNYSPNARNAYRGAKTHRHRR